MESKVIHTNQEIMEVFTVFNDSSVMLDNNLHFYNMKSFLHRGIPSANIFKR